MKHNLLLIFWLFMVVQFSLGAGRLAADPKLAKAWGLRQTEAEQAWKINSGSEKVVVAVIDTGADINHPDLKENLWVNPGEIPGNGIDDDANGYIDDIYGWNFAANNNQVVDENGHGTHIAGIVGARGGNNIGTSGVAPRVRLMILKYFDREMSEAQNVANTVRAIQYATRMKAQIINYSGGGFSRFTAEEAAIREAGRQGILVVAAAGNERMNSDIFGFYPADYGLPNIVSVTAVDRDKKFVPTSNYGRKTVHIAAPGKEIYSTLPGGRYGLMTGTSQATAFVTGVAALLISRSPSFRDPEALIQYLVQTGDHDIALNGRTKYQTRLNAYRALAMRGEGVNVLDQKVSAPKIAAQDILQFAQSLQKLDNQKIDRAPATFK